MNKRQIRLFHEQYSPFLVGITVFITIVFLIDPILSKNLNLSLNNNTRQSEFTQTYSNLNEIKDDSNIKMLFVGSSTTREAIDCNQIELELENHSCYNFGSSGDMPYLRLMELPTIIEMDPDYVLIELGPNSFINSSCEIFSDEQKRECYLNIQWRLGLASIYQNDNQKEISFNNIINEHQRFIIDNKIEEIRFWNSFRQSIYNQKIAETIRPDPYDLKSPYRYSQDVPENELLSTIDPFYRSHGWVPVHPSNSTNLESLIVIIDTLLSNDIEVIFYSTPFNPIAMNVLPSNHWNFYNNSINLLDERYNILHIDEMYSKWDRAEFIDITHLNHQGRASFSKIIINHFNNV